MSNPKNIWLDKYQNDWKHNDSWDTSGSLTPESGTNPETNELLNKEELEIFKKISNGASTADPYRWLKKILEYLTGVQFPELPFLGKSLDADWSMMYKTWFFELETDFENASWTKNPPKTIFQADSLYCKDIAESVSFSNEIKKQFFSIPTGIRNNPFPISFGFSGPGTAKKDYYSWVEWFIGSYGGEAYWTVKPGGAYDIKATIKNTSGWRSATRLPKTWEAKIVKEIGVDIKNLVDDAPRGETIKRKFPDIVVKTLDFLGCPVPSFGGNWEQEYHIQTTWTKDS